MSYRFADSLRAGSGPNQFRPDLLASCQQTCMTYTIAVCTVMLPSCQHINHCCVYGEKLLIMGRGTVRNM